MNFSSLFKLHKSDEELTGLGGWLILLGLGIVGSAAKSAYELFAIFVPLFASDRWAVMTDPGAQGYNPDLVVFFRFEAGALAVLLAINLYVIYVFLARKAAFPSAVIGLFVVSLALSLVDLILFAVLVPGTPLFDDATVATLVGGVFSLIVWGAYVRRSRRVRLTFTR